MSALSEVERARVAHNVSQVKALMPDLVPVIKDLHEAGLIDGWRNVEYVGPARPEPRGSVAMTHIVLESRNRALAERMRNRGKT